MIRKLLLAVLTGWLCIKADAQLARYSLDFTLSKSDFVDSIDIEWERGQVYLPVEADGKRMRFLLDTGAGQTIVFADSPLAQCPAAGQMAAVDANNRRDTVPLVALPPLTLGRLTVDGMQAIVQRRIYNRHNIDGIVGFSLFSKGLLGKIDVEKRLLVLTDRKRFFDGEQGYDVGYRLQYHVPYVDVCPFGKYRERVLFDTGSRSFFMMNKQSFDKGAAKYVRQADQATEGRSTGRHAAGHFGLEPRGEVVFLCLDQLRLGDCSFADVHAVTTQGGSHLGAALLGYGSVIINPQRRRLRFQPYGGQACTTVDNNQLEIAFVNVDGQPVVGLVWEQGRPYQAGFREGDVIVKIDGRRVNGFGQFLRWPFEQGRSYTFVVRDERGFQREVKWIRRP